ncbi:MAG: uracil-DNA glycosylase [Hyphomicrobiaceae bacterium]|nr:uracil-DNA glycosylase [Hyphomicrobiaceae bacterium]
MGELSGRLAGACSAADDTAHAEPGRDCPLCPRLAAFRAANRAAEPSWHNAPVHSFGHPAARLLIVGLAPGLRGANRTGRPFTGDFAGDLLYRTLIECGFASGTYGADPGDGLALAGCMITNAVRCVPPQNKPTPEEVATCRRFLRARMEMLDEMAAVLALGRIAHDSFLAAMGARRSAHPFAHGARHAIRPGLTLFDSYHCSRYNTNTGKLTPGMFKAVVQAVGEHLGAPRASR